MKQEENYDEGENIEVVVVEEVSYPFREGALDGDERLIGLDLMFHLIELLLAESQIHPANLICGNPAVLRELDNLFFRQIQVVRNFSYRQELRCHWVTPTRPVETHSSIFLRSNFHVLPSRNAGILPAEAHSRTVATSTSRYFASESVSKISPNIKHLP